MLSVHGDEEKLPVIWSDAIFSIDDIHSGPVVGPYHGFRVSLGLDGG